MPRPRLRTKRIEIFSNTYNKGKMPKKLVSEAEIKAAWEKKRERDKKAQATWVAKNKETHLARMKEQYVKKKVKKVEQGKEAAMREMMAGEDRDAPAPVVKLRRKRVLPPAAAPAAAPAGTPFERIRRYKAANPSASQRAIAAAVGVSQSSVHRALKKV